MKHLKCGMAKFTPLALATLGFLLGSWQQSAGQDQKVDVSELTRESQKVFSGGGEIDMVWWIPDEFWKASAASNPNATPAGTEMILKVVHPYVMVAVSSGKTGAFAAVTYLAEGDIRGMLHLKDAEGNSYAPLAEDKVDPSAVAMAGILKPMMARIVGAAGQNLNYFFFPASNKDGTRICDPTKEGSCEVDLGGRVFKWKLPLSSLLPKQKCPVCGEILSGAYKYCPYDGTKLAGGK